MNQSHYINEMCTQFLQGSHTQVTTPTDSFFKSLHCQAPDEAPSPGPYNQLIGSIIWVSQCTRPDVSFAINQLSQHLRDPSYMPASTSYASVSIRTKYPYCMCLRATYWRTC
jgi:hypothetical protein